MTNLRLAMLTTLIIMAMGLILNNTAHADDINDEAFNVYANTYKIYMAGGDPNEVAAEMISYLNNVSKRHLAYVYSIATERAQVSHLDDSSVAPIIAQFAEMLYNRR